MSKDTLGPTGTARLSPLSGTSTHHGVGVCREYPAPYQLLRILGGQNQAQTGTEMVQTHSLQNTQAKKCAERREKKITWTHVKSKNRPRSGASIAKYSPPYLGLLLCQSWKLVSI
ncbi:hypothetical protein AMECASPLE_000603 [Ameca splendens]|uniref:Uncharacterized protein n=1 Tax=Ameca splendens TaxID=208324 RepID=A0ABV0XLY6_9TELE